MILCIEKKRLPNRITIEGFTDRARLIRLSELKQKVYWIFDIEAVRSIFIIFLLEYIRQGTESISKILIRIL